MSDNTEHLISKLVASHRAVRPFAIVPILSLSILGLTIFALLLVLPLGIRSDWPVVAQLKSGALLTLMCSFLVGVALLSGPAAATWQKRALITALLVSAVLIFIAFAKVDSALSLSLAMQEPSFWACVSWVAMVGGAVVLVLHRLLKRARPANRGLFRVMVPLSAAIFAAAIYSLHCTVDAFTYLVTAYLLAISLVVCFSLWLSRRLWHW